MAALLIALFEFTTMAVAAVLFYVAAGRNRRAGASGGSTLALGIFSTVLAIALPLLVLFSGRYFISLVFFFLPVCAIQALRTSPSRAGQRATGAPLAWTVPATRAAAPLAPAPAMAPAPAPTMAPGYASRTADARPASGWYRDPWNAAAMRFWDGSQWTGHVAGANN